MYVTVAAPGNFVIWVTSLLAAYEDKVVVGMIKKGYSVSLASTAAGLTYSQPNSVSSIISFRVFSDKENIKAGEVYTDMVQVLTESKACFYSVVVAATADASWSCGNIMFPDKDILDLPKIESNKKLN